MEGRECRFRGRRRRSRGATSACGAGRRRQDADAVIVAGDSHLHTDGGGDPRGRRVAFSVHVTLWAGPPRAAYGMKEVGKHGVHGLVAPETIGAHGIAPRVDGRRAAVEYVLGPCAHRALDEFAQADRSTSDRQHPLLNIWFASVRDAGGANVGVRERSVNELESWLGERNGDARERVEPCVERAVAHARVVEQAAIRRQCPSHFGKARAEQCRRREASERIARARQLDGLIRLFFAGIAHAELREVVVEPFGGIHSAFWPQADMGDSVACQIAGIAIQADVAVAAFDPGGVGCVVGAGAASDARDAAVTISQRHQAARGRICFPGPAGFLFERQPTTVARALATALALACAFALAGSAIA